MFFTVKGYCRFSGGKCLSLKLDKENPHKAFCKKNCGFISNTAPVGGNIKAPRWCPKLKKH